MKQQTEFGEIPLEWEVKQVIEIKDEAKRAIAMGPFGSNIKAENFVESGVPVIRGTNMNFAKFVDGEFVFLTEKKADELLGSNCHPDDLVFTHRGTIGQVALIPKNKYPRYVISQSGMKLTVNQEVMDSEFLFYFFKSEYGQYQILKYEAQVGVPSISNPLTSLKQMCVPVPPLPEQKAIASVLSSLDDKIDLLHRQNKTLEAMAETLFRQWFIEEAKEDWGEVKLGDLCDIITKGTTPKQFTESGVNFIKAESLTDTGSFIRSKFASVSNEIHEGVLKRSILKIDDVLFSIAGTIGRVAKVTEDILPANTNQALAILRPNRGVNSDLIYCILKSVHFQELADGKIVHAVQPNLSLGEISNTCIRLPSESVLKAFTNQVSTYFDKKHANTKQIQTLENLRDTLLPKLMSGEVRVQYQTEEVA